MKIHICGMSPRMVSDRARAKISFSSLLADALRQQGHRVNRAPRAQEGTDLILLGLSSMLSPAASYSIVALGTMGRAMAEGTPLICFVDDPDLGKIHDAAASVRRDPDRLFSDFLAPKRVLGSLDVDREDVMRAVDVLGGDVWPDVLAPMHAWGRSSMLNDQLRISSPVYPLDVSGVLLSQMKPTPWARSRSDSRSWLAEQHYVRRALSPGRCTWPVAVSSNRPSWETIPIYGMARGVYQGAITHCPGWWTPTPLFAGHAGSIYLTETDESVRIKGPFYLTVDQVEALDDVAHRNLAHDQYQYIKERSWDLGRLSSVLGDVLGQSSSFSTPDTTSPGQREP